MGHPLKNDLFYVGDFVTFTIITGSAYSKKPLYNFPGDIARIEFGPAGDVIDKFVLKKERFEKPYSLK